MKLSTLFTAGLVLAGGTVALATSGALPAASAVPAALLAQDTATQTFESLNDAYNAAIVDFKTKLSEADKATRKELRKNAPIKMYWPQFEAMAQGGEGRALVWLADNIKSNKDIKSKQRGEALKPIFTALANDHINAEWFDGALESLARNSKYLGMDSTMALIDSMLEGAKEDNRKAGVLYHGGMAIRRENPEKALAMFEQILSDYSGTDYAMGARVATIKPEDSEEGKIAPSFDAKTIDGFEFNLEDYRGKVVVLDFYGFW